MASWGISGPLVSPFKMRPLLQPQASGARWAVKLPSLWGQVPALPVCWPGGLELPLRCPSPCHEAGHRHGGSWLKAVVLSCEQ